MATNVAKRSFRIPASVAYGEFGVQHGRPPGALGTDSCFLHYELGQPADAYEPKVSVCCSAVVSERKEHNLCRRKTSSPS